MKINIFCELTIIISRLPCIVSLSKAVSSAVVLVNWETSDSVNMSNFAMCTFASKCFTMELIPCSDGLWRTWWETIHMMSVLPVTSFQQFIEKLHEGAWLKLFQPVRCLEPTFTEVHQVSKIGYQVRLLKSRIKTCECLEDIMTSSHKVFKDLESNIVTGDRKLSNLSWKTAKRYNIAK